MFSCSVRIHLHRHLAVIILVAAGSSIADSAYLSTNTKQDEPIIRHDELPGLPSNLCDGLKSRDSDLSSWLQDNLPSNQSCRRASTEDFVHLQSDLVVCLETILGEHLTQ